MTPELSLDGQLWLLVDDDEMVLRVNTRFLSRRVTVLTATDGILGYDRLVGNPKIVGVITDYNMPELTGGDMLKKFQESHINQYMSIAKVGISGLGVSQFETHNLSGLETLAKPYSPKELFQAMYRALETRARYLTKQ